MPLRTLRGAGAVVTGAGSGIGRAVAVRLHAEGAQVALLGRRRSPLEETAGMLGAGASALVLPCDVRDGAALGGAVDAAASSFGGLRLLVNCAAVGAFSRLETTDVDAFDDVVSTNLRGAYAAVTAALPHMRAAGWGRIVNIASRAGHEGFPFFAAYSASKHGLVGMGEAVDAELEDEAIHCHTLVVGSVDTPFHVEAISRGDPEVVADLVEGARLSGALPHPDPVGMLDPADVAEVAVFLCRLPDGMHAQPVVLRPSHDTGPADVGRMVRRGRASRRSAGA